jgi:ComF family protein
MHERVIFTYHPFKMISPILRKLAQTVDSLAEIAFPDSYSAEDMPQPIAGTICHQCGEPLNFSPTENQPPETIICATCSDLKWHFERARSLFRTEGQVLEAITGFKYRKEYHRRRTLIPWITEAYDAHYYQTSFTHLVPVPLHRLRQRARGFNQAHVLAHGLAQTRKHLRVWDALRRNQATSSQVSLNRKERLKNIGESITLKPRFDVKGLHLLIIDDVFTTGATAEACAQILAKSGAARLAVLTIARS